MTDDAHAPADTTMMRIVHAALRRDLERARVALTREPPPDDRQRRAIAGHLDWLMAFLEEHHRSEDLGLYPVVRERRPGAAPLLDDMARDHRAVAAAIVDLRAASATYARRDDRRAGGRRHRPAGGRVGPAPRTGGGRGDAGGLPGHHRPGVAGDRAGAQPGRQVDGATRPGGALADRRRHPGGPGAGASDSFRRSSGWCSCTASHRRTAGTGAPGGTRTVAACSTRGPPPSSWTRGSTTCGTSSATRPVSVSGATSASTASGSATPPRHGPAPGSGAGTSRACIRWGRLCEVVSAEPHELVWRTVPTRLYPGQHRVVAPPHPGGRRHEDRAGLPGREVDQAGGRLRHDPAGPPGPHGGADAGPAQDRNDRGPVRSGAAGQR